MLKIRLPPSTPRMPPPTESSSQTTPHPTAKVVEELGHYDPTKNPPRSS